MGLMTSIRQRMTIVLWALLFLFVLSMSIGGLVGGANIIDQIAGRVDDKNFIKDWMGATDDQELKEILLRDERFFSLTIRRNTPSFVLVGNSLRDIRMPEGCLVALIRRKGETIVPRGLTELMEGDRLTIIGDIKGIEQLINEYS